MTGTTAGNVYTVINGTANTSGAGCTAGTRQQSGSVQANGTPGATTPATPGSSTSANLTDLGIGVDRANGIWVGRKGGQSIFRYSFAAGTSGTSPDTYTDVGASEGVTSPGVQRVCGYLLDRYNRCKVRQLSERDFYGLSIRRAKRPNWPIRPKQPLHQPIRRQRWVLPLRHLTSQGRPAPA